VDTVNIIQYNLLNRDAVQPGMTSDDGALPFIETTLQDLR
jgi:hypothetical protein